MGTSRAAAARVVPQRGAAPAGSIYGPVPGSSCCLDGRRGVGYVAALLTFQVAMRREMTGFDKDEAGDWVAELSCGHRQHVRHKPPFFSRPWTQSEQGRAAMLGQPLSCVRCDRLELPAAVAAYKRTPEFDEHSLPEGLRRAHTTKAGTWGVLHVLAGRLRYCIEASEELGSTPRELVLDPATPGIIPPQVPHHVEPLADEPLRFFVEFLRRPQP